MKISFVIPIYNQAIYLDACLSSLQRQTLSDIEFIVVDDGSTDHSKLIVESYLSDKRFCLTAQTNQGASVARNTGIQKCQGEYIAFADADDILSENFASDMYKVAMESNADIVIGQRQMFDGSWQEPVARAVESTRINALQAIDLGYACWARLFKRSLIQSGPLFPPHTWAEDNGYTPYLYSKSKSTVYFPQVVYGYRRNPDGTSLKLRSLTDAPLAMSYLASICDNPQVVSRAASESLTNAILGYAQKSDRYFENLEEFLSLPQTQHVFAQLKSIVKLKHWELFSLRQRLYFVQFYLLTQGFPTWTTRLLYLYNHIRWRISNT